MAERLSACAVYGGGQMGARVNDRDALLCNAPVDRERTRIHAVYRDAVDAAEAACKYPLVDGVINHQVEAVQVHHGFALEESGQYPQCWTDKSAAAYHGIEPSAAAGSQCLGG